MNMTRKLSSSIALKKEIKRLENGGIKFQKEENIKCLASFLYLFNSFINMLPPRVKNRVMSVMDDILTIQFETPFMNTTSHFSKQRAYGP